MAYLGHTIGLRRTTLSYKNKKMVDRPKSEQIVVENTHEALITQEVWDIAQSVRQHKKRTPKQMEEPNIFSGLVFCADCGKPLVLHRASTMKKVEYNFKCYTYGKKGKAHCSPHHIREYDLTAIVLDDLRRVTHFARQKERQFAAYINKKNSAEVRKEINSLQRELDAMRKRSNELSALFKRLYEGWGEFNWGCLILHWTVDDTDVPVDDLDLLTGMAGVFLAPLPHLNPLNEQTEELRGQLLDVRIPLGFLNEGVHVGGGGFQTFQMGLLLWHSVLQRFLLGVVVGGEHTELLVCDPAKYRILEKTVIALGYQADGNRQEDTTSVSDSLAAANTPAAATKDTISIPA